MADNNELDNRKPTDIATEEDVIGFVMELCNSTGVIDSQDYAFYRGNLLRELMQLINVNNRNGKPITVEKMCSFGFGYHQGWLQSEKARC